MEKIKNQHVFRDPIHGYIHIDYEIIRQIIDTPVFQRLRRIKQLSGVHMVFHGAEHSRFTHSLGVYEIANRFLTIPDIQNTLSQRNQLLFLVIALLHDIGHGPYSHAFEDAFGTDHEKTGAMIITQDQKLRSVLDQVDNQFADDIASIILKLHRFPIIEQLISSQLDVDRLDYLVRDAYYTGVTYGTVDLDRLMRVLRIKDGRVVFKVSGIHAIENYLISRYHMYWQVYYHRVSRAYEVILNKIYMRIKDLIIAGYPFKHPIHVLKSVIENPNQLDSFLKIDDYYINGLIGSFLEEEDAILKELAYDFLNRRIWQVIPDDGQHESEIKHILAEMSDTDKTYFVDRKTVYETTYVDYNPKMGEKIYIVLEDQTVSTLSNESSIIRSLMLSGQKSEPLFFYKKR